MALKGVKPKAIEKRAKLLIFGPAGVGKTTAAIQMPKPYLIDTEKGATNASYVRALEAAGGAYFFTNDADELITEVRSLLSEKHSYKTLVIDSLSPIYNDLLNKSAEMLATADDPTGTAFSRHKGPANRKVKHLLNLLARLDMNIVITAHSKTKWEKQGTTIVDVGQTFDCYDKLEYLFDLVFEVQRRGKELAGIVKKTRLEEFPMADIFPFSYAEFARRYGGTALEKDATPEQLVSLADAELLGALLAGRKDGDELLEKWLSKASAETIEELPADVAKKCIGYLQNPAKAAEKAA